MIKEDLLKKIKRDVKLDLLGAGICAFFAVAGLKFGTDFALFSGIMGLMFLNGYMLTKRDLKILELV